MTDRRGFTLLELLMVVVIIGILAGLAIPQYLKTTEKARIAEAVGVLGGIRSSQIRYFAENSTYGTSLSQLDLDPSAAGAMAGTPNFTYTIASASAAAFDATATRSGALPAGSGCTANYRVHVNQAGTFTGRDCQTAN